MKFVQGGHYPRDKVRVPLEGFERIEFVHNLELHSEHREMPEIFELDDDVFDMSY